MNQNEPTALDIMGAGNHDLRCLIAVHIEGREAWQTPSSILLLKPQEDLKSGFSHRLDEMPPFDLISLHYVPDWPRNMRKAWNLLWSVMSGWPEEWEIGGKPWQCAIADWFPTSELYRHGERAACTRICQAVLLAHFGHEWALSEMGIQEPLSAPLADSESGEPG